MDRHYSDKSVIAGSVSDSWYKHYSRIEAEKEPLSLEELEKMDLDKLTPNQLELLTTRLLYTERKATAEDTSTMEASRDGILNHHQWKHRRKIEICVPDLLLPESEMGNLAKDNSEGASAKTRNPGQTKMYNRSAPEGRKVHSRRERTKPHGSGYYR